MRQLDDRPVESGGWRDTIAPGGIPDPSAEVDLSAPTGRHRADADEEPPPPETEPEYAPGRRADALPSDPAR
ncbi:hypothetical protein [Micromonospora sp. NPDC051141]|uniref:hypothetical protein n=1 Tax=Micromonospora sp. NPDC051141 TaxID=3364284 RepID=UPI00378FEFD9